jgi:hypothetical protein
LDDRGRIRLRKIRRSDENIGELGVVAAISNALDCTNIANAPPTDGLNAATPAADRSSCST